MSKVVKKQFATPSNITQIKIYRFLVSKSWVILATIQCIVDWHSEYPPAIKLQLYCHTVASSPSPPPKSVPKPVDWLGEIGPYCAIVCVCAFGAFLARSLATESADKLNNSQSSRCWFIVCAGTISLTFSLACDIHHDCIRNNYQMTIDIYFDVVKSPIIVIGGRCSLYS